MTQARVRVCDSWLWTARGSPPSACVFAVQRGDPERDVAAGSGGCGAGLREVWDCRLFSYTGGVVFFG